MDDLVADGFFAICLREYLFRHGWPVDKTPRLLLVGAPDGEWTWQILSADPTSAEEAGEMAEAFARAVMRVIDASV